MQFPESWLREFCDPPLSTAELAELLTMSGFEVEALVPAAPPFTGVVVGRIVAAERHPNADRLQVCTVDVGEPQTLQIVCGAPNARPGIRVPCARVGASLPPAEAGGPRLAIRLGELRGVQSQGMLCSARELQIADDAGGLLELAPDAPVGRDLREALALDDTLFTLKLTPNLGHALSVHGIAREVAALTGAPLKTPAIEPVRPQTDEVLPVRVEAPDLCGRFSGRVIRGVNPRARTPDWMVQRLARCGQRSVSALVDISNYVMFEYGRPTHVFDLGKIHGGLQVRWGRPGETLELLNGSTVTLDGQVGVIADERGVESLAGIMGGEATAVSDDTVDIYAEAAFWWPEAVAGRSRRYAFSTDAGHRFERGVDATLTALHLEHLTRLIVQVCGTEATRCGPVDDQVLRLPERPPVALRIERAQRVIGMPVTESDAAGVMRRLGFAFEQAPGVLTVTPPSWRFDLQLEEDLIEEVARVIGYQRLPTTPPRAAISALPQPEGRRPVHALRDRMATLGYFETVNYSFVETRWERELAGCDDPVKVLNPIAAPMSVMRTSLIGGLVAVLRHNLARKAERVRVFELGRVYLRDASATDGPAAVRGLRQPLRLAGLAAGPADDPQWGQRERGVDFFDVKADVEALFAPGTVAFVRGSHPALHPGRCAELQLDGRAIGVIGELHPRWRQAYELPGAPVVFEIDAEALLQRRLPAPVPVPRQHGVFRDLAVVAGEGVTHQALMQAVQGAGAVHLKSALLFDVFQPAQPTAEIGPGERSLAVRLELRDDDRTLTDERIEADVARIVQALQQGLGLRLRG